MIGMSLAKYSEVSGFPVDTIRYWKRTRWTEGVEYSYEGRRLVIHPEAIERGRKWRESGFVAVQSGSVSDLGREGAGFRSGDSPPRRRTSSASRENATGSWQEAMTGKV